MTLTLAHIINPVNLGPPSDLAVAQPVTFATMRAAREFAAGDVQVDLFSAQYPEDHCMVPDGFLVTPDLDRSVLDVAPLEPPRKLPLIADILGRLYDGSDADYMIYTNVDIALQPSFYLAVARLIESGLDAFVINKRIIPANLNGIHQIPLMYAEIGKPHRGWDCFVFKRDFFPRLDLGHACIGVARIDLVLLANLVAFAPTFQEFKDLHLTFHIGDDRSWRNKTLRSYDDHNTRELMAVLARLQNKVGPFSQDSIPGSFLLRKRLLGPAYEFWSQNAYIPPALSRLLNTLLRK